MMACVCQFVICLVGTKSGTFSVIIPFVPEAPVTLCMKTNTIIYSVVAPRVDPTLSDHLKLGSANLTFYLFTDRWDTV